MIDAVDAQPYIELTFRPTLLLVAEVRRFVSALYDVFLTDPDATSRIGLTTHELLENAMKYSTDGKAKIHIEIRRVGPHDVICLRISNHADPDRLLDLRSQFESMRASRDSFTYFTDLMVKSAKRTSGSGLGLARIWAEAEMKMSCEIEGGVATIVAEAAVDVRQTS
jgi:two-component sensor histidine kinase